MSNSIQANVAAAVGLQNHIAMQESQNSLLRKTLDNKASTIASLISSVPTAAQLASSGSVGTLLHATA